MPTVLDNDEPEPPKGCRSLQDISAVKFLEEMKHDPGLEATFLTLDNIPQHLVFKHLYKDYRRLLEFEEKVVNYCPRADRRLWTHPKEYVYNPAWRKDKRYDKFPHDLYNEKANNGFRLRDNFRRDWYYELGGSSSNPLRSREPKVEWYDSCFIRDSLDSPLRISRSVSPSSPERVHFTKLISSQLLLYRLLSVFHEADLPTEDFVAYKSGGHMIYWTVDLVWSGDDLSRVVFQNERGGPLIYFEGRPKASCEALKLIDWLVSNNVPVADDGTIAGKCAQNGDTEG